METVHLLFPHKIERYSSINRSSNSRFNSIQMTSYEPNIRLINTIFSQIGCASLSIEPINVSIGLITGRKYFSIKPNLTILRKIMIDSYYSSHINKLFNYGDSNGDQIL